MKLNSYMWLIVVFFALSSITGCGKLASVVPGLADSESDQTEDTEDSNLVLLDSMFKAGGLEDDEASALIEGIKAETVPTSSLKQSASLKQSSLAASDIPTMIRGAMKALGKSAFEQKKEKKMLAIRLISAKLYLLFKNSLGAMSSDEFEELIASSVQEQVKASSHAGLSGEDRKNSFKDILKEAISSCEEVCSDSEKKASFVRGLTESTVGSLSETGMSSSEIEEAIPAVVDAAVERIQTLTGASAEEKQTISLEVVLKAVDNIERSGAPSTAVTTVTNAISTVIENKMGDGIVKDAVTEAVNQNRACEVSTRFAYMFEFSDPYCQNLERKYIEGPLVISPLERGFPNHAFCYRNSATGKYQNWIGAAPGCSATPPTIASFPNPPSPRNITVANATAKCMYNKEGSGGFGDMTMTNQTICEGMALRDFLSPTNTKLFKVTYESNVIAVFDSPTPGVIFPSYANKCFVALGVSATSPYRTFWVRDADECKKQCKLFSGLYPSFITNCRMNESLLETYSPNTISAGSSTTPQGKIKIHLPDQMLKGRCLKVGLSLTDMADNILPGVVGRVYYSGTRNNYSTGPGFPMKFYSNSNCYSSSETSTLTLAFGAEVRYYYTKVDSFAVSADFLFNPIFYTGGVPTQKASALAVPLVDP